MTSLDLAAIRERYTLALNAKPSKGPYSEKGIAALTDSVCDVPELLREIDRLNATIQRVREQAISLVGKAWDDGNATGLDGWVGPGRGSLPIDTEAQHARTRMVHKADRALEGGEAS